MTIAADRRRFLRGDFGGARPTLRPPWALDEARFVDRCTRCGACIEVCPEHILVRGSGGFPEVDFAGGACTFCGECRQACGDGALALAAVASVPPWPYRAVIGENCLALGAVACQVCGEHCETDAIRFAPRAGGVPEPAVYNQVCTGCGACLAPCPVDAIGILVAEKELSNGG